MFRGLCALTEHMALLTELRTIRGRPAIDMTLLTELFEPGAGYASLEIRVPQGVETRADCVAVAHHPQGKTATQAPAGRHIYSLGPLMHR